MNSNTNNTPQPLSYLLARLAIAASMFGHGLVRMPKLQGFSDWMVESFSTSMMPLALVRPFSFILPFAELIVGLLLIVGLFTRAALIAGSIAMLALIFGSCIIEKWEWVTFQMFYGLYFALLLAYIHHDQYSVDAIRQRSK
jgi:thiosulfate dehydrogenase [quinone] large subunit